MLPTDPFEMSSAETDDDILADMQQLWREAEQLWDASDSTTPFQGYVSADYPVVFEALQGLKGQVLSILEWGSGLGVVTIMASRLGFDAYGIEVEPELVDYSTNFAARFGPHAQFAEGSFIPEEFDYQPRRGDEIQQTRTDVDSAYLALDMELRDFDLVYAYPWPEEYNLFRNIVKTCGNPQGLFMSFDVREGLKLERMSDETKHRRRNANPRTRNSRKR